MAGAYMIVSLILAILLLLFYWNVILAVEENSSC